MKRAFSQVARRPRPLARNTVGAPLRRTFVNKAHAGATTESPPVEITTLPNKIRVATEGTPGHFSSVGVYIDAGSRYESPKLSGCSHVMDRMAFKSTKNRSGTEMSTAIDSLGGQILCSSSRETILYQSSHFNSGTPLALSLLSDTITNPLFLPEELELQKQAAAYEVREIHAKPELILPELLHHLAYQGNTLGNPLICPEERLELITGDVLRDYVDTWYKPERMVIAGAGMPHAELVELADKYFGSLKPEQLPQAQHTVSSSPSRSIPSHLLPTSPKTPSSPSLYKSLTTAATSLFNPVPQKGSPLSLDPTFAELSTARARYTGGQSFIYRPELDMNHVYLGFDGVSIHDDDIYPLATIQILLGGGGSFSAGGPGKGMYSRLYTHVLNHHSSIDHCSAFHHIYTDTSLFGLIAVAHENYPTTSILPLLAHQLSLLLYHAIPQSELTRAKNQLMSSLVMALESRSVEVEDLGRQVLVHGRKVSVDEMCDKIRKVRGEDIRRVAQRLFGGEMAGPPTILVMGKRDVGEWQSTFKKYGLGRL